MTLALVTGASSGLGRLVAKKLAEKKIPLIVTGRDAKRLEEFSSCAEVYPLDLTKKEERKTLLQVIKKKAPDLVINAAGAGLYGRVLEYPTEKQMDLLEINANAPIEIAIEAARALYGKKKEGIILNVSSAAGYFLFPTLSIYACAKASLTHFSQSFDAEMKPYGIRILVSCPGQIDTGFIYRAGGKAEHPRALAMSAEYAVERIFKQIKRKKGVDIFDFRYRLFLLARLLPKGILMRCLRKSIEKRYIMRDFV